MPLIFAYFMDDILMKENNVYYICLITYKLLLTHIVKIGKLQVHIK